MKPSWAFCIHPTPVLNTPDFSASFSGKLSLDKNNLLRCVETVLLPGSLIELLEPVPLTSIWKIRSGEYPYSGAYYVDERFIKKISSSQKERSKKLPAIDELLAVLEQLIGTRYIWGGNWPKGISLLLDLYPPQTTLDPLENDTRQLKGVDCSGLFYFVTDGYTPRNTSSLLHFGESIPIQGKTAHEIANSLLPLDFIVWKGHVISVWNQQWAIESLVGKGVITTPLEDRLLQVMENRSPKNEWTQSDEPLFVARRWHPEHQ